MSDMLLRISTAEAVVNHIKGLIASGALRPGDKLPSERILQDELGISRFALREGLARLNAVGIITSAQGKASVVNAEVSIDSLGDVLMPMGSSDNERYLRDLFFARQLIECTSARLAAECRDEIAIADLRALLRSMEENLDEADVYASADDRLHHRIVDAAGNHFLTKIHELLQVQLKTVIRRSVAKRSHRKESIEWHRRIVAAIAKGHGRQAEQLMADHLASCRSAYGSAL